MSSCEKNKQLELPKDIKAQTQSRIDKGYHLGTIIGIIDEHGTRYYRFGQMSLMDESVPDEHSIFEIASITKPFTATLLANMQLNNEIDISNPIEEYLPIFKEVYRNSNRMATLADLINHTSGLPRNPTNADREDSNRYGDYSIEDLNDYLSNFKIVDSTRTYKYSNLAYLVLEHAMETQLGTTYEALVENRVLNALNMNDSHFVVPEEKRNRLATPYRSGKEIEELNMGVFPAGGGLKSTAKDMLRFLEAQLGMRVSSLDAAIQMTQEERFSNGKETLGLAWSIMKRKESGKTFIYHKGGSKGFVSFAGFNPEDRIGVVVLVNGTRWFSDLGFKILDPSYPLSTPE